ncbi:hypothetical protein PUN28_001992 [Cardiocondyla obscurior]|uniref:Secreted protein n=1 Tax=Cardiocondyla obscurior TaxID=286306 RepID=A0AAW2GS21_9HYME
MPLPSQLIFSSFLYSVGRNGRVRECVATQDTSTWLGCSATGEWQARRFAESPSPSLSRGCKHTNTQRRVSRQCFHASQLKRKSNESWQTWRPKNWNRKFPEKHFAEYEIRSKR